MQIPNRNALGKSEIKAINQVIKYYSNSGKDPGYQDYFEEKLCSEFSRMMNGGYTDACATGSSALFIAISALELKPGSEILISPVSDPSPINATILLGHKPRMMDSQKFSYNINIENVLSRVTKKTKAIIVVHAGGEASDICKISNFAKKNKIKLIEDCSQAPFAKCHSCMKKCSLCKNKFVGEYGDIAVFSTMFSKTISSCGSGGLTYTKNKTLSKKLLAYADRGKRVWETKRYLKDPRSSLFPALNLNSNEFSCAITHSSLNRSKQAIKKRQTFLKFFISEIRNSKICKPQTTKLSSLSPFYFSVIVDITKIKVSKNEFAKYLLKNGITLLPEYGCIYYDWEWSKKYIRGNFFPENAIEMKNKSFNLFLNENYNKKHAKFFAEIILRAEKKFLKK